jgi:glycosyltransferase involved in cell wall biosynthesis
MTEHRPLRVAIVAPPFYEVPPSGYGGTELICGLLAEHLVRRGHDIVVVGAGRRRVRSRFVATFPEPQPEGGDAATRIEILHAARAAAAIEDLELDLVHDHSRYGGLTAAGRSIPTVVTVHSAVAGPDSATADLESMQRWVSLVAISVAQRQAAAGLRWVGTVHHGVDVERYRFRADKDGFVLYLGRISQHKGAHLAVEAARAAGRPLVIAGSWTIPAEREYFAAHIRPRLGDGVDWVGEVDFERKIDLLGRAACLLFPAQWDEPFGLVQVEAMACGTPVVALGVGAVPELVADGQTGVICDSPAQLPSAIARATALDPRSCRDHVAARFDAARMAREYETIYRRLLTPGQLGRGTAAVWPGAPHS